MRITPLLVLGALAACTNNAPSSGAGSLVPGGSVTTINISLTTSTVVSTAFGNSGGFTPAVTTVPVGTTVRFVNVDSFAHTSTSMTAAAFPDTSPFGSGALTQGGGTLSAGWTSGSLAAGAASQPLLADKVGTYLYGCFFHYGAPMRAAIVVH